MLFHRMAFGEHNFRILYPVPGIDLLTEVVCIKKRGCHFGNLFWLITIKLITQ